MKNPNDDLYKELVDILVECESETKRNFMLDMFTVINGELPSEYVDLMNKKLKQKGADC